MISVIVPFYNVEPWIGDTIESVIVQIHREWELILIDDGSADQSADVADRWAAIDGRIRVIRLPHGGVSVARNVGLDEARGTFVTFLDADDILERDTVYRYRNRRVIPVNRRCVNAHRTLSFRP